ncbi:hypothetical protein AS149_39600 [Burkholderia cenocepacia]|nr:hypothetical protein AS149_39600 [Burkholderia cenocepacia]
MAIVAIETTTKIISRRTRTTCYWRIISPRNRLQYMIKTTVMISSIGGISIDHRVLPRQFFQSLSIVCTHRLMWATGNRLPCISLKPFKVNSTNILASIPFYFSKKMSLYDSQLVSRPNWLSELLTDSIDYITCRTQKCGNQ